MISFDVEEKRCWNTENSPDIAAVHDVVNHGRSRHRGCMSGGSCDGTSYWSRWTSTSRSSKHVFRSFSIHFRCRGEEGSEYAENSPDISAVHDLVNHGRRRHRVSMSGAAWDGTSYQRYIAGSGCVQLYFYFSPTFTFTFPSFLLLGG